jgi:hypothetical protein
VWGELLERSSPHAPFKKGFGCFVWGFAPNPTKNLFEKRFLDFPKLSKKGFEISF